MCLCVCCGSEVGVVANILAFHYTEASTLQTA
jgi:hypothetical protein